MSGSDVDVGIPALELENIVTSQSESEIQAAGERQPGNDTNAKPNGKVRRSVTFPTDDLIVASYMEPPNPWISAATCSKDELVSSYKRSCEAHCVKPFPKLVTQLQQIDEFGRRYNSLSLKGERLELRAVESLEEIFRRVQFNIVEVEATHLDDESAIALFDMLEYYESATRLNMSFNKNIGPRGWLACSKLLKKTPCIEFLDARNCVFTEQTMPMLGRAIRMGSALTILHLENANLSGRPLLILVAAIKLNECLKELFLADNRMMPSDGIQLGNMLKFNHKLELLDVRNNHLQDVGVSHLCDGLYEQSLGQGLKTLVLWNNQITYQAMPSLGRALSSTKGLETLNLGHNNVTNEGIHTLKDGLLKNKSLLRIGLQAAKLSCEGAVALAEYVADSLTLVRLDLRENDIKTAGLMAIGLSLKVSETMLRVDLDKEPKRESGVKEYAEQQRALLEQITSTLQRNKELQDSRAEQKRLQELQNKEQEKLNQEQEKLNQEQEKLNQEKLNQLNQNTGQQNVASFENTPQVILPNSTQSSTSEGQLSAATNIPTIIASDISESEPLSSLPVVTGSNQSKTSSQPVETGSKPVATSTPLTVDIPDSAVSRTLSSPKQSTVSLSPRTRHKFIVTPTLQDSTGHPLSGASLEAHRGDAKNTLKNIPDVTIKTSDDSRVKNENPLVDDEHIKSQSDDSIGVKSEIVDSEAKAFDSLSEDRNVEAVESPLEDTGQHLPHSDSLDLYKLQQQIKQQDNKTSTCDKIEEVTIADPKIGGMNTPPVPSPLKTGDSPVTSKLNAIDPTHSQNTEAKIDSESHGEQSSKQDATQEAKKDSNAHNEPSSKHDATQEPKKDSNAHNEPSSKQDATQEAEKDSNAHKEPSSKPDTAELPDSDKPQSTTIDTSGETPSADAAEKPEVDFNSALTMNGVSTELGKILDSLGPVDQDATTALTGEEEDDFEKELDAMLADITTTSPLATPTTGVETSSST